MMGSMGHALPIGIGVAMATDKDVVVLDGDGAILMQMGAITTYLHYYPINLRHIILNNNCYDSTGGQPTTFNGYLFPLSEVKDVEKGARDDLGRIPLTPKQIVKNFYEKSRD